MSEGIEGQRISELPAAGEIVGNEIVALVQAGVTAGATTQRSAIVFETPMRSTPTVTLTGQVQDITAVAACTASATANASAAGCTLSCTGNAATAVGNLLEIPVTFDARLV